MRKQKIDRVISKRLEVLQGISHKEPLRVVTRNAELLKGSRPGVFLTFNDVTWFKGHTLEQVHSPSMETPLPKPNMGTLFLGGTGSLGASVWTLRSESPNYFMKNTGQNFFKSWNSTRNSGICGHQTCRLESLFSLYILYISVFSYGDKL